MKSLESLELKRLESERERLDILLKLLHTKDAEDTERMNNLLERIQTLHSISNNTEKILKELDAEFESQTGLTCKDFSFLILATVLQCLRQYFVTDFKKPLSDKEAAKQTWGHNTESSSARRAGWYYASKEEIISSPVPFDASTRSIRAQKIKVNAGLGGTAHRTRALGHDPVLGLYFGTANILTKTVTLNNLQSYHIKKGMVNNGARDTINSQAFNHKIVAAVKTRVKEEPDAVAAALLKEIIHLRSDIKTTTSLPLPFISRYDEGLARDLSKYGFDMANLETIGKQATYAPLINYIIACIHRLLRENDISNDLYEVRTKKIITYSNLIATYSNVFTTTLIAPYFSKNLNSKIDLGGYVYTFCNALNTIDFIYKVKEEFIFNNYLKLINNV